MPSSLPQRPKEKLGPAFSLKEINVLVWSLFCAALSLITFIAVEGPKQAGERLQAPNADFVYFYGLGKMLNEYPADSLYDYELQKKVVAAVRPDRPRKATGPNPYPPFIAVFFQPFARLPYTTAYLLWLSICLILYSGGLALITARLFPGDGVRRSLSFCFALSFYPFLFETMINGHLSPIGFFVLALALREEDLGHPALSGMALSLCLYKPTLLVLTLPMLLFTKRYKALAGFVGGAVALVLFTTLFVGVRVWSGYINLVLFFARSSTGAKTREFLRLWKYIDLKAFTFLLPGGANWIVRALVLVCALGAAVSLFWVWRRSINAAAPLSRLTWAATLTWTLLLNLYVPIYDSLQLVLSVALTASVLPALPERKWSRCLLVLSILIYVTAWFTQSIAAEYGIQPLTILLVALGSLQLAAARRLGRTALPMQAPAPNAT